MNIYVLVLRFIHVGAGVFWIGVAFLMTYFLGPAVNDTAPAGPKVMGALERRGFATAMMLATSLATVSGLLLYWRDSGGLRSPWMFTGTGIMFGIGGIAGIASFVIGMALIGPISGKMGAMGAEIEKAGGPPTPEQAALLGSLRTRLERVEVIDSLILVVAVLGMSLARYVSF